MGRRWRAVFAGLGDDEKPDDLAHRPGRDGRSALDAATHATRTISLLGRALEQVLVDDEAVVHPAVGDAHLRGWDRGAGDVDEVVDELAHEADRLADRVAAVTAPEWTRRARVASRDADVSALEIVWDAVDTAVADLRAAEATLREVCGRT
jgi:hypothetical protein